MALGGNDDLAILMHISGYLREIASFNRRAELSKILDDPEKRLAYELSDGTRNSGDIASNSQITKSDSTIRRWWGEWREAGLVEDDSAEHPTRRYATFVLDLPEEG